MSKAITITFDRQSAALVLKALEPAISNNPACQGCGKPVSATNLGAVQKINGVSTVWHNNLVCLFEYIHALDESPDTNDTRKEK